MGGWGKREGVGEQGGEMTQTIYAHVNKGIIKIYICKIIFSQ
jgi:hypothetical protein